MRNDRSGPAILNGGHGLLMAVLRRESRLFLVALLFSIAINALMLTGPFYMLQVYDRVLGSGSKGTLIALSVLAAGMFLAMAILDFARARVLAIAGARFQIHVDGKVFAASLRRSGPGTDGGGLLASQRDLEKVRSFIASSALATLLDILAAPFFLAAIFAFHRQLGLLALGGGILLTAITVMNHLIPNRIRLRAENSNLEAERLAARFGREGESSQTFGMADSTLDSWLENQRNALSERLVISTGKSALGSAARAFRLLLQSAMLGLGAWLVLDGELSAGSMFAVSILLGRALAPVELMAGQWLAAQSAHEAWSRLACLFGGTITEPERISLPRPRASLEVEGITVMSMHGRPPGLQSVSFRLNPGEAIGVIGPTGSGKSTLARAIVGTLRPTAGKICLGGIPIDQYGGKVLGQYVGYLAQRPTLFDGTIAQNIARFHSHLGTDGVVSAAMNAGAHEMIANLADGYETQISEGCTELSAGQIQRICLARALFGDPAILVLDEPTSNLDSDGCVALNVAIESMKAKGGSVVVMAHRPSAIQECDRILVLGAGRVKELGPRDIVLIAMARKNTGVIRDSAASFVR